MFVILHDKIVGGLALQYIEFFDVSATSLCQIPFYDVVEGTIPGEFYFQDPYASRIIRGVVGAAAAGGKTVDNFKIYDDGSNVIIEGDVTLLNGGGDIVFNSLDWDEGQVAIISSLKIYFPTED